MYFMTDDVGWMDFGFNGGGIAVGNATPSLDQFAAEGLILTSAYATPSCTPARATIMTGENPLHHGLLRPPMYGESGGLEGAATVASILKKPGCKTQGVGMNAHLVAVRIDEFKYHMVVQLQNAIFPLGLKGGFSGAVLSETGGSVMVNLYENPQEDFGIGNRYLPIVTQMGQEVARYGKVLAKYPLNIEVSMPGSSK
nr:sulfatase-like hydrolase/transferase [Nitrosococcus watsonii]